MNAYARIFLSLGALSAAESVVVGAASAHSPNPAIVAQLPLLQTALQYQQFHALAILLIGVLARRPPSRLLLAAGGLMLAGTLLFSINLQLRVFADVQILRAVVPAGGGAFILAWVLLALAVWTDRRS